jgi:uncharacterized membrane protein YesL
MPGKTVVVARASRWREGLEDFSDCLVIGLLIALASIPVLTVGPALAAGCHALHRTRQGISLPVWPTFWRDFARQARGGVPFTALAIGVALLLAVDVAVVGPDMPGGRLIEVALWVAVVAVTVIGLRTCEVAVGEGWRRAVRTAARQTVAAPRSAALIAGAACAALVLVWMQPLLVFLVGGPLVLALVATGERR